MTPPSDLATHTQRLLAALLSRYVRAFSCSCSVRRVPTCVCGCVFLQVWQRARELCPSLPTYDATTCAAVFARRHALPIPEVGRYKLAAQVDSLQGSQVVFAGDYLSTGTVEGALRSGMRAALLVHGQPAM